MLLLLTGLLTTTEKFPMTIESIMRGYALVGHSPSNLRWSPDGKQIGFTWGKADGSKNPPTKLYIVNRDGTGLKEGEVPEKVVNDWDRGSKAGYQIAYEALGDIWIRDTLTNQSERITKTEESESSPVFVQDAASIIFTRKGDLFRYTLAGAKVQQLTESKAGEVPEVKVVIEGPTGFARGGMNASPSGTCVAVNFSQSPTRARNAQIAHFITASGYVELESTYAKVGEPQGHSMVRVFNLSDGKSVDIMTPRPGTVRRMQWAPDGKHGALWAFSEDHKDAWLYSFDTRNDKVTLVWNEHDNGWVGGPGEGLLGWLPDSSKVYFESENSGFANLMESDPDGIKAEPIVTGRFEVSNVTLDAERKRFIFISSEGSPYDRHVDSVDLDGKYKKKLADLSAGDDASFRLSPDGSEIAMVKSSSNRPAELFVNKIQVTTTPTAEWLSGPWIDPPSIDVPARDGTNVPEKLFKPKSWRKGCRGVRPWRGLSSKRLSRLELLLP